MTRPVPPRLKGPGIHQRRYPRGLSRHVGRKQHGVQKQEHRAEEPPAEEEQVPAHLFVAALQGGEKKTENCKISLRLYNLGDAYLGVSQNGIRTPLWVVFQGNQKETVAILGDAVVFDQRQPFS